MFLLVLFAQLWVSAPDSKAILSGNWQSCRDGEGHYAERVFDYAINGELQWSFHMGPHQFALYRAGEELVPDDHDAGSNLLSGGALVESGDNGSRTWLVRPLHLRVHVVQAGGSREECQSWFVRIERAK